VDGAAIARRFALGATPRLSDGPVARGRQGAVWRLDTSDGRWAVKVPFDVPDEDEARRPAELQEAAWAAGVPTPQVRRTVDGALFAAVDGYLVRVYGWVDLLGPDSRLDPALVGGILGRLHQVRAAAAAPEHPWYREPVGAARWDQLITELRAARAPFVGSLASLRDELVALESWLEPPATLRACHRDLWADNLRPVAGGGATVIDWENSGLADPSQELGCVLFEFARDDPGRARALRDAYRDAGGPGRVERRGQFSMLIAQLGHITELAAADWLQPNQRSPDRASSEAWIREVLDDPHTRARLGALLAALA
jgi:Ser/Thr protein kinase RdoA (MazF antagonist)